MNEARSVKDKVYMHLYALSEKLDAVDNYDDELLNLVDIVIVKLAKIVSRKFLEDTKSEHATVKTIYDIKNQSQPLSFLMSGQRCRSVIECFVAFSGVYMKSNIFEVHSIREIHHY